MSSLVDVNVEFRLADACTSSKVGWNVICLDPRSFRLAQSKEEAFGSDSVILSRNPREPINIWAALRSLPNSERHFLGTVPSSTGTVIDDSDYIDRDALIDEIDDFSDDVNSVEGLGDFESSGSETPAILLAEQRDVAPDEDLNGVAPHPDMSPASPHEGTSSADAVTPNIATAVSQAESVTSPQVGPSAVRPYRDQSSEGGTIMEVSQSATCKGNTSLQYDAAKGPSSARDLPFYLLFTSEEDVQLYTCSPSRGPEVYCPRILHQRIAPHLGYLERIRRLNMTAHIPELGIVVVGSQIGRAAVLALTRSKETGGHAFRVECVLPLQSQEEKGQRPPCPLLGLAVSPVQGRERLTAGSEASEERDDYPEPYKEHTVEGKERWRGVEASRRYRLLLTYWNHSVLSYELGWDWPLDRKRTSTSKRRNNEDILIV